MHHHIIMPHIYKKPPKSNKIMAMRERNMPAMIIIGGSLKIKKKNAVTFGIDLVTSYDLLKVPNCHVRQKISK